VPDPLLIARQAAEAALERGVPGLVVGVVAEGAPVHVEAFGKIERASVVRVGSITKVFTAIGIAQLVEHGIVGWDDPVERHLRSYPFRPARGARPPTIREVLTHTAGFGEFRRLREWRSKTIPFAVDDGARIPPLSEYYADGLRATTAPGRGYSYANHAFASLGQLIEDVTGKTYERYVRERILEPLGMTSSHILLTDELRARLAQGWHLDESGAVEVPLQHIVIAPAGSLHSTLDDMLRFVSWVSTGGQAISHDVLQPSTLATMFERHFEHDLRLPGQGLGFTRDDLGGEAVVGHDGGFPGFVSSFAAIPGKRFGVFACATAIDLAPRNIVDRTIEAALDIPPPEERVPQGIAVPARRERFAGVYAPILGLSADARWWNEYGGEVRFDVEPGGLRLSTPKGSHAEGVQLVPGDPHDEAYWVGAGARMGVPQLLRVRFTADGFDGAIPQLARMRKRPAIRSVRVYGPLLRIGRVAAPATVISSLAALLLRRRGRARSARTARRSRPR
jgi:CubicO group peptidase (beta-lactamase class C family)